MLLTILVLAVLFTGSPLMAQQPPAASPQTTTVPAAVQPVTTVQPNLPATPPATTSVAAPTVPAGPTVPATSAAPRPTTTSTGEPCPLCDDAVNAYWTTFWVISGLLAIALLGVALGLNNGPWSLTDALADKDQPTMKVQIPVRENGRIKMTDAGTPVTIVTEAHPSSASRLIALLGTLVLIAIMLGVGYGMIWSLFTKGQIPALEGIGPYLLGGGALFAPYAFNQLKEAFRKN